MSGPTIAGQCEKCGGWASQCNCGVLPTVRSEPLLADAIDAIRALVRELENFTVVFGEDDEDEQALALGRGVLSKANAESEALT